MRARCFGCAQHDVPNNTYLFVRQFSFRFFSLLLFLLPLLPLNS